MRIFKQDNTAQGAAKCFVAGTAVLAAVGVAAIELIAVGDLVWAYDDETGDAALKEVVQTFKNETYELTTVRTDDGQEIVSTPEHPYFVKNRGWILAKDLRAGDILLNVNGQEVVGEEFAKLMKGEVVVTPQQINGFMGGVLPKITTLGGERAVSNVYKAPLVSINCGSATKETLSELKRAINAATDRIVAEGRMQTIKETSGKEA